MGFVDPDIVDVGQGKKKGGQICLYIYSIGSGDADDWLLSVVSLYLAMQGHPVAATLSNRHRVPSSRLGGAQIPRAGGALELLVGFRLI